MPAAPRLTEDTGGRSGKGADAGRGARAPPSQQGIVEGASLLPAPGPCPNS